MSECWFVKVRPCADSLPLGRHLAAVIVLHCAVWTERLPSPTQNKYTCMTCTISVIFKVFSVLVYDQMLYCPFYTLSLLLLQLEISFISKNAFQFTHPWWERAITLLSTLGGWRCFASPISGINRNAPICGIPCGLKDLQPETQQKDASLSVTAPRWLPCEYSLRLKSLCVSIPSVKLSIPALGKKISWHHFNRPLATYSWKSDEHAVKQKNEARNARSNCIVLKCISGRIFLFFPFLQLMPFCTKIYL